MSLFTVMLLSDALVVPAYSSATISWMQRKVVRGSVPRGEQADSQITEWGKTPFEGVGSFRVVSLCWFIGVLFPIYFKYGE